MRLGRHNPPPGRRIVVHVGIEGSDKVSESAITAGLRTYSDNFGSFDNKPLLDLSILEEDERRVESAYAAHGYFSTRCVGHRVEEVDDVSVRVFFEVVEGAPSTVHTLTIRGLEPTPDDPQATARLDTIRARLDKLVPIAVGDTWTERDYLIGKAQLHEALRAQGFVHAEVVGESRVDVRKRRVEVIIDAVPGPLARVSGVRVLGNSVVSAERIMRRVDIVEGQIVDLEQFDAVVGRLFELGVFFSVSVKPERMALDLALAGRPMTADTLRAIEWPKAVSVAVTVQEKPFQEIRAGGGFELETERSTINLLVGYRNLSLGGGERFFDVAVSPKYIFTPSFFDPQDNSPGGKASLLFKQPAFIEEYLTLSLSTDYEVKLDDRGLTQEFTGAITFSRTFWNLLTPNFTYSANLQNRLTDSGDVIDESSDPYIVLSTFEQGLTFDWRDNLLDPRSGLYARVSVSESFSEIGSDYDFVQLQVDARGYVRPFSWLTLALRTAYAENYMFGERTLPVEKWFKGGGAADMRGFSSLKMGPTSCVFADQSGTLVRDGVDCPEGTVETYQDGGNIKALASFEARIYFPYDLGLVAFVDAGQIWTFSEDVDWKDLEIAVGPGLRYYTVIGPIRADFGLLLTSPSAPDFEFHLSIGQAF